MTTFSYKAKDRAGNTVTGAVEAATASEAAGMVREMGHLPMDIQEAGAGRAESAASREAGSAFARYFIYPLWTGVNIKMLALFYRQLATLLASGMPLSQSLDSIGRRQRGRLGIIVQEMRENVTGGGRLSDTLVRYPRIFSKLQIALIQAGEAGGLLEQMVERVATYLEYEIHIRDLLSKALIYPIIILLFAWLAFHVVPVLPLLMERGFAPFIAVVGPPVLRQLCGFLVLVIVLKLVFQFEIPRLAWDYAKSNIPVLGGNARKIAMSRFSNAMAVLYAAGMSMAQCVDIASDACANLYLSRSMKCAVPAIQSGQGLTESLSRTRVVSPMVLDMLAVGERTGSTDAVLRKAADFMDAEVDSSIHKIGIALFVIMIVVAGIVVGSIVIGFWGGFYSGLSGAGS